nr:SNF2-related protein [Longirhabdus pacifica]
MHMDQGWKETLQNKMDHNGPWDNYEYYKLAYEIETERLIPSFDDLQCLAQIQHITPLPHQIDTAKRVLYEMRGRAILADEVGLGKTIEAGLILKEYMIRGLVRKALILVPASLVLQWVRELNQKFGIPAVAQKKKYMWEHPIVVASMDTAKRDPHKEMLLGMNYDMLIIDEAHKLKNKKTTNYQFITQLTKKYCLLLTATPMQNDLKELYNLVTLLKPGHLGALGNFKQNFVVDKRQPKNETELKQEIQKVMIRNLRSESNIPFTKRNVQNITLDLSKDEQALYDNVTKYIKDTYQQAGMKSLLSLVTLQREVCSSRDAVFVTLFNMFKKLREDSPLRSPIWELILQIKSIESNTKADTTLDLIKKVNDKVIIFTEYRASQEYLLHFLKEHQIICVPYRGGMNRGKKDWMMDLFKRRAQVMIATEAGGEGINLQFCHHVINFDLPWNPMRVEQRIGRVHRLGQAQDVNIYNLSTKNTIEEHILHLLHEKINLFEKVVGNLDVILEKVGNPLEKEIMNLIVKTNDEQELRAKISKLGDSLSPAPH